MSSATRPQPEAASAGTAQQQPAAGIRAAPAAQLGAGDRPRVSGEQSRSGIGPAARRAIDRRAIDDRERQP